MLDQTLALNKGLDFDGKVKKLKKLKNICFGHLGTMIKIHKYSDCSVLTLVLPEVD